MIKKCDGLMDGWTDGRTDGPTQQGVASRVCDSKRIGIIKRWPLLPAGLSRWIYPRVCSFFIHQSTRRLPFSNLDSDKYIYELRYRLPSSFSPSFVHLKQRNGSQAMGRPHINVGRILYFAQSIFIHWKVLSLSLHTPCIATFSV